MFAPFVLPRLGCFALLTSTKRGGVMRAYDGRALGARSKTTTALDTCSDYFSKNSFVELITDIAKWRLFLRSFKELLVK